MVKVYWKPWSEKISSGYGVHLFMLVKASIQLIKHVTILKKPIIDKTPPRYKVVQLILLTNIDTEQNYFLSLADEKKNVHIPKFTYIFIVYFRALRTYTHPTLQTHIT